MTNRYFAIANILLITAGVYLGVKGFYNIFTARLDFDALPQRTLSSRAVSPADQSKPPRSQYDTIVDRNLFNIAEQEVAVQPKTIDIENLEETALKLKLWGTVTRQDGLAYAVIEDTKTKQQDLYRTGDAIENATVKMILREKVVLNVSDRDEILTMEEAVPKRAGGRVARQNTEAPKLPVSSYPRQITLNREYMESAMANLSELMEQANLRPHIEDGKAAGISITGIKPNAIFRRMRLRNGDIITGVNGNPIESVEDAVSIFENLSSASEIKVDIKRRGRQQTLDYRIE